MMPVAFVVLFTGTTSMMAGDESVSSPGPACPRGLPAAWAAIAQMAEKMGQARLVPPIPAWAMPPSTNTAPVYGSARAEMSGDCRALPGIELCQDGLAMKVLVPPPEPPIFPSASGGSNTPFKANDRMLALVPQ